MRKFFTAALAAATLVVSTPTFAFDADSRATAVRAEQLAGNALRFARNAFAHGRAVLGNKADVVARDARNLAVVARRAARGTRGDREIRSSFVLVRGSFQDLRDRWIDVRGSVRDQSLRADWQATQAAFQSLRREVR